MKIQEKFLEHIGSYNLHPDCMMAGDVESDIAIVGEYPGAQEAATGVPFSGGSGRVLWDALRQQKIYQPHCYVTNVVKRPVSVKSPVSNYEYDLWNEAFNWEMTQIKPKVIVCLGNTALHALLGFDGITKYRGSVYEYNGIPVVVANNPALVLRNPETEIIFAMDMEKVARVYRKEYKTPTIKKIINPSYSQAMDYIEAIRRKHKVFSADIEITGYETACLGLGISSQEAMCINFRDKFTNRFTAEEEFNVIQSFVTMCDDPSTYSIAQNGNFDSYFMGYKDHAVFQVNFDTLLAHHTLYPKLPHNLGFLTSQYTDHPYYKDDIETFKEGGDIDTFWEYNCQDCAVTFEVYEKELEELKDQKLFDFFTNHVMRLQPHLSKTTATGVLVDIKRKEALSQEIGKDVEKLRASVIEAARDVLNDPDYTLNPNSHKQLQTFLFDRAKVKYKKRSTDAKSREEISKDPRTSPQLSEFLARLGQYATEQKYHSVYVESKVDPDNRFRSEFKQYGVSRAPGRLSSGQTIWGSGGNAQNQPHRAYEMYLADDGNVWIYFDLAQAEARYVAWDANIEGWIADFERARLEGGFDAHRSLASQMFGMPYDEVPTADFLDAHGRSQKDPDCDMASLKMTKRYVAKRCRHGLNYRMYINTLAQQTGMSYAEAASNYYIYHRTTPELKVWWADVEREIKRNRMLFNAYGRRFISLERLENSDTMDSIIAFKPQSSIGDKTQRVWYQCHEDDRWDMHKARIALNVHDALYGIATPDFAMTALSIMKKYAEEPIMVTQTRSRKVVPLIIPADCKMSQTDRGLHRMSDLRDVDVEIAA